MDEVAAWWSTGGVSPGRADAVLRALATMDAVAIESLAGCRLETVEASGLDARTCALVTLASLASLQAPPAAWSWHIGFALESGATAEDLAGALIAIAPTIGLVRAAAAAAELARVLELDITWR